MSAAGPGGSEAARRKEELRATLAAEVRQGHKSGIARF